MRNLLFLALLGLMTALPAQGQSGRHFLRSPRTPATAGQAPVADASARTVTRSEPLRRLRSGRAWSLFHFSRRPVTPAAGPAVVEASTPVAIRRTPFWGRKLRRGAR